jgi:hypothetical protein
VKINDLKLLFIGIYMPYYNNKMENLILFESILMQIEKIMNIFKESYSTFLLAVFNSNPNGKKRFDSLLKKFINKNELEVVDKNGKNKYTYSDSMGNKTDIDHVIKKNNNNIQTKFDILDDPMNMSDHCPIKLKIKLNGMLKENINVSMPIGNKASDYIGLID